MFKTSSQALIPLVIRVADALTIVGGGYLALHARQMMDRPLELNANIYGYYALMLMGRNMVAGTDWGFVEQLYVQEPDRKRGIGRELLELEQV